MKTLTNTLKIVAFTFVWSSVAVCGAMATTYPMTAHAHTVSK